MSLRKLIVALVVLGVIVALVLGVLRFLRGTPMTIIVTSASDSTGKCPDPQDCTLRAAITLANANADSTIQFTLTNPATINVTSALPSFVFNTTLAGPGNPSQLVIRSTQNSQVFQVNSSAKINLSNLTIENGNGGAGYGGAIRNSGSISVTNSTFTQNKVSSGYGGAICNGGSASVTKSIFTGNSAASGYGGGIYNSTNCNTSADVVQQLRQCFFDLISNGNCGNSGNATLIVIDSTFTSNSAPNGYGGGIYNGGSATVTNSTFSGNSAPTGYGGGIYNNGSMTVTKGIFTNNLAPNGYGGGIYSGSGGSVSGNATLTVTDNSSFMKNLAPYGGGIYNGNSGSASGNATLNVASSTFSGNSAIGASYGGGIYNGNSGSASGNATLNVASSTFSGNSANASSYGGGIYNGNGGSASGNVTLNVASSIFSGNSAISSSYGGGIASLNNGTDLTTVNIISSTFFGNLANASSYGGGIYNLNLGTGSAILNIASSTFSGNSANGASYGGGISNLNKNIGSAILNVANSTFSGNSAIGKSVGGGISNVNVGTGNARINITSSTFSGNSADSSPSFGGSIYNLWVVSVQNSIIVNSLNGSNCAGLPILPVGANLTDPPSFPTCPGTIGVPLLGNLTGNPGYLPLQSNSQAIGKANPCTYPPGFPANSIFDGGGGQRVIFDQRGYLRPTNGPCDIGAYDSGGAPPTPTP